MKYIEIYGNILEMSGNILGKKKTMKLFKLKLPAPISVRNSGYYLLYTGSKKEAKAAMIDWIETTRGNAPDNTDWREEDFDLESVYIEAKWKMVSELNEAISDTLWRPKPLEDWDDDDLERYIQNCKRRSRS